jgi:hypothetical protein
LDVNVKAHLQDYNQQNYFQWIDMFSRTLNTWGNFFQRRICSIFEKSIMTKVIILVLVKWITVKKVQSRSAIVTWQTAEENICKRNWSIQFNIINI